jgi:hypothetical protein
MLAALRKDWTPMPDGPRYDDDFYAWTQYQAEVLRTLRTRDNRFDREHVAEEIEDLGNSERNAVRSQVRRILEHFLKLTYSPAAVPRHGWRGSITDARSEIADKLSPTLRRDLEEMLGTLYARAKRRVIHDMDDFGEHGAAASLPAQCPYTLDQVLDDDWYPEPAEDAK